MQKANYYKYILLAVLTAVVFLFSSVWGGGISVYAAVSAGEYSDVLEDLTNDPAFSQADYPEKRSDSGLSLIQIAESVDGELFLYVYQPSGQFRRIVASSVNISTTLNDEISYYNYKLQLLSSYGTLFKYLVKDFTVKSDPTRYYCFTSIYRPFDESLGDKQASGDNKITEVDYPVNKQYCFSIINGRPYCSVIDIETITVTEKFVGFIRYNDGGYVWGNASCDNHIVAFDTDKPIDKLLEADVYYTTQEYSSSSWLGGGRTDYGEKKYDNYAYLTYTQKVEHTGGGLFAATYKWETIQTVARFLETTARGGIYSGVIFDHNVGTPLTDEALEELKGKKWVLRFAETPCNLYAYNGTTSETRTLVGDVTILRLKFETDGVVYNLGVIDNKQTGSFDPINTTEWGCAGCSGNSWWLWIVLLAAILLLIILFPSLLTLLGYIVKAVIWLVTLPFKAIGELIKKKKANVGNEKSEKGNGKNKKINNSSTSKRR